MLATTVLIGLSCLAATTLADTALSVPVDGTYGSTDFEPVDVGELPQSGPSTRGDDFGVSEPDEVFTADLNGVGEAQVGTANGETVDNVEPGSGRRLLSAHRKLLQTGTGTLDLSGSGVSVGDSTVGASAQAYGHGELDAESLQDNHVEPHGVTASATVAGEDVSDVNAAVDPDCDGSLEGKSEGPCATVSGRK